MGLQDRVQLLGCGCLTAGVVFGFMVWMTDDPPSVKTIDVAPKAAEVAAHPGAPLERRADLGASPAPAPAPAKRASCVIGMKGTDAEVPVLPTEEGFDEFTRAVATGASGEARLTVFRANGGFHVDKGTPCVAIETGFASSRVRVLEGPHAGKAGWLPNEWRIGE